MILSLHWVISNHNTLFNKDINNFINIINNNQKYKIDDSYLPNIYLKLFYLVDFYNGNLNNINTIEHYSLDYLNKYPDYPFSKTALYYYIQAIKQKTDKNISYEILKYNINKNLINLKTKYPDTRISLFINNYLKRNLN